MFQFETLSKDYLSMEDGDVALFPLPTPHTYAYSFHLYILLMWIIYHFNLINIQCLYDIFYISAIAAEPCNKL